MDGPNNDIVLYHYSFSPYARRVIWYLALRGIDYAQCVRSLALGKPEPTAIYQDQSSDSAAHHAPTGPGGHWSPLSSNSCDGHRTRCVL
jgi:hypothetical protein